MLRSGSTWSFNVCRHLAEAVARRRGETVGATYANEADLDVCFDPATGGGALGPLAGPLVFKAHAVGPRALAAVRAGAARAVCTFRDPRDCIASHRTFTGAALDDAIHQLSVNMGYLSAYRAAGPGMLFVRYEDMVAHPLRQVARIAAHLGVDADEQDLRRIDALTGLSSARATVAGLRHRPADRVLWCDGRRVDPVTHLHENHCGGLGRVGRWRDELPLDEQRRLTDVFSPWLVALGYESSAASTAMQG